MTNKKFINHYWLIIKNLYIQINDLFLDFLFPKFCVSCGQEGVWVCKHCANEIILIKTPTCPSCGRLTPKGQFCPRCRGKTNLTGIITACYYQYGPLKEAVHSFKYHSIRELNIFLGDLLIKATLERLPSRDVILIPVPLHRQRLIERGFNQAELLAQHFNQSAQKKIITRQLARMRYTRPQVELTSKERKSNLNNAFFWKGSNQSIQGKTIILVDDLTTTTSTLKEAAKVLRAKGARQVWGLVLAHG
jgi:ComF family protein